MAANWIEAVTGSLDEKRQYKRCRRRIDALPEPYHAVAKAMERYLMYFGSITKGDVIVSMLEDLVDLFEQAAAEKTSIARLIGDDPVEFAETFIANYSEGQWINKERRRFVAAVEDAEREERRARRADRHHDHDDDRRGETA